MKKGGAGIKGECFGYMPILFSSFSMRFFSRSLFSRFQALVLRKVLSSLRRDPMRDRRTQIRYHSGSPGAASWLPGTIQTKYPIEYVRMPERIYIQIFSKMYLCIVVEDIFHRAAGVNFHAMTRYANCSNSAKNEKHLATHFGL